MLKFASEPGKSRGLSALMKMTRILNHAKLRVGRQNPTILALSWFINHSINYVNQLRPIVFIKGSEVQGSGVQGFRGSGLMVMGRQVTDKTTLTFFCWRSGRAGFRPRRCFVRQGTYVQRMRNLFLSLGFHIIEGSVFLPTLEPLNSEPLNVNFFMPTCKNGNAFTSIDTKGKQNPKKVGSEYENES